MLFSQHLTFNLSDTEVPTILNMPSDITQNTDTGAATAVVTWTPATASDNSGSQTLTSSHNPGDLLYIGDTAVTYTSVDPSGNKVTNTFVVTIQGT